MGSSRDRAGAKLAREQGDSIASKLAPTINGQHLLRTHSLTGNREHKPFSCYRQTVELFHWHTR